jgi:decaprenyl-phosphate phosphoribosyltransferase
MTARMQETGGNAPVAPGTAPGAPATVPLAAPARRAGLLVAAVQAVRPRQWPKNLLVFAAPLAGATLGRDDGFGYALLAFVAFTAAASAVYVINDVLDAKRDRLHPTKRLRPVASGRLARPAALMLTAICLAVTALAIVVIGEAMLAAVIGVYIAVSLLYSMSLKHVPGVELAVVASGFVLRALGGAVATHVPPSGWFLTVCSLGALMVAIGKRYTELSALGTEAAAHRPVMRWYSLGLLRAGQRAVSIVMLAAYLFWALSEDDLWMRGWHVASVVPLALALFRFDRLTGLAEGRPVEDLIVRDPMMLCCELTWLTMFTVGL